MLSSLSWGGGGAGTRYRYRLPISQIPMLSGWVPRGDILDPIFGPHVGPHFGHHLWTSFWTPFWKMLKNSLRKAPRADLGPRPSKVSKQNCLGATILGSPPKSRTPLWTPFSDHILDLILDPIVGSHFGTHFWAAFLRKHEHVQKS